MLSFKELGQQDYHSLFTNTNMAKIKFQLNGKERIIDVDSYGFIARDDKGASIGNYRKNNLGGAIMRHVREAILEEGFDKSEVVSLQEFVDTFDRAYKGITGIISIDEMKLPLSTTEKPGRSYYFKKKEVIEEVSPEPEEQLEEDDDL